MVSKKAASDTSTPGRFVGRKVELQRLREVGNAGESSLVIVHGRYRIGKTALIEHAYGDRNLLKIEGVEGQGEAYQIQSALRQIAAFTGDPAHALIRTEMPDGRRSWRNVFHLLSSIVAQGPWTLHFKELQWLAAYEDAFAAELKYSWDNFLRHNPRLLVVLCGSSPSFMINHIVRSRALYGRSQHEIPLQEFSLAEAAEFMDIKSPLRVMDAYLSVGGIPEYLRYLRRGTSVYRSLCENSFRSGSFFSAEWDKIFVSSRSKDTGYKRIVEFLSTKRFSTREEILRAIGMKAGGTATEMLADLELCGFIQRYSPYNAKHRGSRLVRYAISDYFLQFYSKFIQPEIDAIRNGDYNANPTEALSLSEHQIDLISRVRLVSRAIEERTMRVLHSAESQSSGALRPRPGPQTRERAHCRRGSHG